MPSTIRLLDDWTINQIAAGEVIENPASVVKELVDNALDAQGTSISIEIKGGGQQLIRVSDNGKGMSKDDALLSFERHATSKVSHISDLEKLMTMGFRGEALAAIAAISKVRMKTRLKGSKEGTLVEMAAGKCAICSSIPCEEGTSIEITELFFNAPARKKFLKSPAQNTQEIHKCLISFSLAYPELHFQLISDGDFLLKTAKTPLLSLHASLQERVREILHPEICPSLKTIAYEKDPLKIEGLVGTPSLHRPNRTNQYLFLNRRPISSWLIAQAILEGYGTALPERRFPLFVLHLSLPPSDFDVNVHPQKKEVRFRQEGRLKQMIREAIASFWDGSLMPFSASNFIEKEIPTEIISPCKTFETKTIYSIPPREPILVKEKFSQVPIFFEQEQKPIFAPAIIGTILNYVLLESSPLAKDRGEGLCLMDCKRAEARILYEQLVRTKKETGQKQALLVHFTLELSPLHTRLVSEHLSKIEAMGFSLRPFGPSTWAVEAIPSGMEEEEAKELLHQLIDGLDELNLKEWEEGQRERLAKAAIGRLKKRERRLTDDMASHLIKQLLLCQQPYFSPHGGPIFAWLSLQELSAVFHV